MARTFSRKERNVIIAGAIFLVCFLLVWFVLLPKRESLANLKSSVRAMQGELEELRTIESQYNRLTVETEPVMNRLDRRRKDFDLSAFVAETENRLNFIRTREIPLRPTTHGDFEKRSATFIYSDKTLRQIVEFLQEIENPDNVVGIETLRITPKSATERSLLELNVRLFTVVRTK
jgi:hypothetical protein